MSFLRDRCAAYAQAKIPLERIYAKYFAESLLTHANDFIPRDTLDVVIEDVTQSSGSATVLARERVRATYVRTLYLLSLIGGDWKIVEMDIKTVKSARNSSGDLT